MIFKNIIGFILLLLSRFSRVRLCATPQKAAHQAPPSLGFSRQEQWSGFLFPSPMHESEKWKWSRSVLSDSSWPHGLQPTRLLCPWDFPSKSTGVGCHCLNIDQKQSLVQKKLAEFYFTEWCLSWVIQYVTVCNQKGTWQSFPQIYTEELSSDCSVFLIHVLLLECYGH